MKLKLDFTEEQAQRLEAMAQQRKVLMEDVILEALAVFDLVCRKQCKHMSLAFVDDHGGRVEHRPDRPIPAVTKDGYPLQKGYTVRLADGSYNNVVGQTGLLVKLTEGQCLEERIATLVSKQCLPLTFLRRQ